MALVITDLTAEPRSFSIGPMKIQIVTYTAAAADTTGTVSADRLGKIDAVLCDGGLQQTVAPTLSGHTATITFTAVPTGGVAGTMILIGR